MEICSRCLYNEIHPFGLQLEEGICLGCKTHEEKNSLNWIDRLEELKFLLRSKTIKSKTYDCVIPVVGDAEDFYVVKLVLEMGLNPLIVSVNSYFLNDIGWQNLHTLITNFDVDSWIYNPEINTYKELIKTSLRKYNHMYLPWLQLHTSFPIHVATEKNIPLVIWGGLQAIEQVGKFSHLDDVQMTSWSRVEHDLFGKQIETLIGNGAQINERNLNYYKYPSINRLSKNVEGIYLSNYFRWDPLLQNKSMVEFGFTPEMNLYTFDPYERAGSSIYYQVHDILKYERLGYRKITDHCVREIRHGRIDKVEAKNLELQYTNRKVDIKPFFDWLGVTQSGYEWFLKHRIEKSTHLIGFEKDLNEPGLPNSLLDFLSPGKAKERDFIFIGKGI